MDVKTAVATAKSWVLDVLVDENISNVGLEEVKFNEHEMLWEITIGFSRPWNSVRNAFTTIAGDAAPKRVYRVIRVRDNDGSVISMTKRSTEE